ncbi:Aste57867_16800 [Aphanomyces stellatus]|uniref:Aste57867_16800 protein n=1 Tax=Aphanomyces stellatus TaxID=120398 RepID=A0A485L692_9STRA|nr:hypothetical protein As57867_016743 [Aphanomyces stellatus]VFT93565.1 Aste57867_16800 [Aphanomyces stellatus]
MEPLYDRTTRVVRELHNGVTFMQFNVLADGLCDLRSDKGGFHLSPPECLPWSYRRDLYVKLLDEIERYMPDIICLEEIDHYDWVAARLAPNGYVGHFVSKPHSPCLEVSDAPDGCAVFVRKSKGFHMHHICSERFHDADGKPGNQIALIVHVTVVDDEIAPFLVVCTHLKSTKSREGEALRAIQVEQLLEHLERDHAHLPMVVCGDYNATPDTNDEYPALAVPRMADAGFQSAYAVAESEPRYTTWKVRPGNESRHVIDYIFFKGDAELVSVVDAPIEIDDCRLPSLRYPSDHIALVATITFPCDD